MRSVKEVWRSMANLVIFARVVWRYRWYDYYYPLDFIVKDLELKLVEWGVNTHYVGDKFTRCRIQVVLRYHTRYATAKSFHDEDYYLRKFLKAYTRLLPRLWD